ncbi:MAG: hypothetical protein KJS64_06745 [Acidobacteria bacterium]|nr:hypothetical protein [Acidobacteriota bacterium]
MTRSDVALVEPWTVRQGTTQRGGASCDFAHRALTVPLGGAPIDRLVRAHELMHLRISPVEGIDVGAVGASRRAVECAEECRVNEALRRLGFAVNELRDGSEKTAGARVAAASEWSEAVSFFVALRGSDGERDFLQGIRSERPEWVRALRAVKKEVDRLLERVDINTLCATPLSGEGSGFQTITVPIARLIDRVGGSAAPRDDASWKRFKKSLSPGARRAPSGRFATLVIDESRDYVDVPGRTGARRRRYDVSGVVVGPPSRTWRDDRRRVFRVTSRAAGGVIVIDQSGSMNIGDDELDEALRRVPGVTVIGYSHRPGDTLGTPNAWILATQHQRVREVPSGNVGNGVDGPALRWALSLRRPGDILVWVTDGQVTDSNDHPDGALTAECGQLVRQHQIRLAATLDEALQVLRSPHAPRRYSAGFGRIGRFLGISADVL